MLTIRSIAGFLWLLLFILFLIFSCQLRTMPGEQGTVSHLQVNKRTGHISVKADEASLFQIIKDLKENHQVEVIVPNMTEDRKVSVNISEQPLDKGLAALIPADLNYYFRTREIETIISGTTGDKKVISQRQLKPKDLPTKGKTEPLKPEQKFIVKVSPEDSVPNKYTEGGNSTKIHPAKSKVKEGRGKKIPKKPELEPYRYARLNLFIDSNNNIRVERLIEVKGQLIESKTYNGPFLYTAYVGDTLVSVGTMQDPLIVRSIDERPGRLTTRAKSGFFSISLPEDFLNKNRLARARINFYLLVEDTEMPDAITPKTIMKIEKRLKITAQIGSEELLNTFSKTRLGGQKDD